jgi:hypothetical protein
LRRYWTRFEYHSRSTQVRINPEDLSEARGRIQDYIQAGMTHLILSLHAPYPKGIVHRLDEEIVRPLKAEFELQV